MTYEEAVQSLNEKAIQLLIQLSKDSWVAGSQNQPYSISREEAEEMLSRLARIELIPEEE